MRTKAMESMKTMKRKGHHIQRLSVRVTVYFSIVVIITYVALALLISNLFSGQLLREMDDVLNRKLNLVNSELSASLTQIQNLHASIVDDNTMRNSMTRIARFGVDTSTMALVQGRLTGFARRASYITSIVAIEQSGHILHSSYSLPPYPKLVEKSAEYQTFRSSLRTRAFTTPDAFPLAMGQNNSSITYLGHLYDSAENYQPVGTVAINLKSSFLFANIKSLTVDSFDACFLTDPSGAVVYQTGRSDFETMSWKDIDETFRVYQAPVSGYPDWQITCAVQESVFHAGLNKIYRVVAAMSIITLICVIFISFHISKTVTRPIKQMQVAMVQLGAGEYPSRLNVEATGEMQDLLTGFNTMMGDIQKLTAEILEKQKREKEYEVSLVQNQLDLLQAQINPHFIHNTLNTMKYMAQTAGNINLMQTITAFNALLRASMSSSGALVSVAEEILNTENYLHLQRNRYEFDIRFTSIADDAVKLALLPKLILQPLVENALFHGIAPADGGTISIQFKKMEESVQVEVADDGVGVCEELVNKLISGATDNPRSYSHVGLKNVNERLILLYGIESELHIQSQPGCGTVVSFRIPFNT